MPLSYMNTLYWLAEQKIKTEEGKKELAASELEDELEEVASE